MSDIAWSWCRRCHRRWSCFRRIARSLATRLALRASPYRSPACGSSFTAIPARPCCQGWGRSAASRADRRLFGVPTRSRTGGGLPRICSRVAAGGRPRSISQIRSACP